MAESSATQSGGTATRTLYGWLTAVGVSAFGDRMSMLAIPWFVLTTTGSPVKTGLVAVAELTPMVVLQVLSGPLIDRVGPARMAVWCDAASMVVIGTIPVLHHLDLLTFPVVLVLVALAGALRGPSDSAKDALIPHLSEYAGVPIERSTGLENAVYRAAMMIGSAVAGALIVLVGPANAVIIDAVTFGISALLMAWATAGVPRDAPTEETEDDEPASYLGALRAGWRFLRRDRLLLGIAVMLALVNMLDMAFMMVLVPVWADKYAGPAVVGFVFAVWNLFAVLGSLAAARWGDRWARYPVFVIGFLLGGLPRYAVFAFDTPIWLVMLAAVVGGFSLGVAHPVSNAVQFDRIPKPMVGRVMTLVGAMSTALLPLSGLLGGGLVEGVGLTSTMLALGIAYVIIVLIPALDPDWKQMNRPRAAPPAPGAGSSPPPAAP